MSTPLAGLAFATIVTVAAFGQINSIAPDWVFVSTPLRWKSPHIHKAPATLLVVYPNGVYASIACVLIEQSDGTVTISHRDGYIVRKGTWKRVENELIADATVVSRTLWLVSKRESESSRTDQFKVKEVRGYKELKGSDGQKYAPLTRFTDFDGLTALITPTAIRITRDW